MPYIQIKAYPKDEKIKQKVAEKINEIFLEEWGCPQEAISLSIESVQPEKWQAEIERKEILPNSDKMLILNGKKTY
ncbi:MAG: tautomerase family protein [Clostridia bacterium]|nr:tautomerase family protein [Clostridia bacterium]